MPSRRRASHLIVLGAAAAVVAVASLLSVFVPATLGAAIDDGARAALAAGRGAQVALAVTLPEDAADPEGQDEAVRSAIARTLGADGIGMPLSVHPTRELAAATGSDVGALRVVTAPELAGEGVLVDGTWPDADDEATLPADEAATLGLAAGDALSVGDLALTIVGTWRSDAPQWSPEFATTAQQNGAGPLVVSPAALQELADAAGTVPLERWTIVPDADRITAAQLSAAGAAWRSLRGALADAGVDTARLDLSGLLLPTALSVGPRTAALQAAEPLALVTLAMVALVALLELARVLAAARASGTALLWARGAGTGRLARDAAAEAAWPVGVGAALGLGIGLLAAAAAGASAQWSPWLVVGPLLTAVVAEAVIVGRAVSEIRALESAVRRRNRAAPAARAVAVALVAVAAVVCGARLVLSGSTVGADGTDPLSVLAPSLAVIALVVVGVWALSALRPLAARWAARRADAVPLLVTRALFRGSSAVVTPLLLTGLAVAQLVVAAGFAGTWNTGYDAAAAQQNGTAFRVTAGADVLTPDLQRAIADIAGSDAPVPVSVQSGSITGQSISLVAIAAPAAAALVAPELPDRARLLAAVAPDDLPGIVIPPGTRQVRAEVEVTNFRAGADLAIWLLDEEGRMARVAGADAEVAADVTAAGFPLDGPDVATLSGELRLVAVDATPLGEPANPDGGQLVTLQSLMADDSATDLSRPWLNVEVSEYTFPSQETSTSASLASPDAGVPARLMPDPVLSAPPLVVSQAFAVATGSRAGDQVSVSLQPRADRTTATVAAVVSGVPGADLPEAVLVDSRALVTQRLLWFEGPAVPDQIWLPIDPTDEAALERLRAALPPGLELTGTAVDPARAPLVGGVVALWAGAAGAALLAVAAIAAVVASARRTRRTEAEALSGAGMTGRARAAARAAELGVLLGAGAVVGAIVGAVVVVVLIPAVVRAAVPGVVVDMPPVVAPGQLAIAAAALALLLAAVVWTGARGARRDEVRG